MYSGHAFMQVFAPIGFRTVFTSDAFRSDCFPARTGFLLAPSMGGHDLDVELNTTKPGF
jgi:hypothetical protein